jgi:hypothetical protein
VELGLMEWTLTAAEMLTKLTLNLDNRTAKTPKWPKTPKSLSGEMRRIAPTLAENRLYVFFNGTKKARLITLTSRREIASGRRND